MTESLVARGPQGLEHRWGLRIPCCATARISAGVGISGFGRMRDVSISGAFIETTLDLPPFVPIEIAVQRKDGHEAVSQRAWVVRRDTRGIGIEWVDAVSGPICPVLGCTESCARPC